MSNLKEGKNRGGIVEINIGFGLGLLSYNKAEFVKNDTYFEIKTYIFCFFKYEEIVYRY